MKILDHDPTDIRMAGIKRASEYRSAKIEELHFLSGAEYGRRFQLETQFMSGREYGTTDRIEKFRAWKFNEERFTR